MRKNSRHNWADLPKETLKLIGKCLETRVDVFRFRAICTRWRSVVPLLHNTPTLSLPLNFPPPLKATATLSSATVYRLEDETRSSACLIKVTESSSGEMKIMNPLYSRNNQIIKSADNPVVKSIDVLSLRVVEVTKGYYLNFKPQLLESKPWLTVVKKVVLFGECGIIVIYGGDGKLGFFEFKDEKWTDLGNKGDKFDDIVVFNSQIYVVDSMGTLYWVNGRTISLVQFSPPLIGFGHSKNLVVSEGELFVVDFEWVDSQRVELNVFRLDEEWGTWVEVNSLGDRVFVLSEEVCYSVSIKDFPGCLGNCVYFLARVFDMEDRRRAKLVYSFPSFKKLFSVSMNFPVTCTFGSTPFVSLDC